MEILKYACILWVTLGAILLFTELVFVKFYGVEPKRKDLDITMSRESKLDAWDIGLVLTVSIFAWLLILTQYVVAWPRSYKDFQRRIEKKSREGNITWEKWLHS